ncbi:MAG: GNAT family N-acetyltransferase [Brevundimonas sp.]|nr:GNAT family N-acetyltransferase [Brevundimonas sp.]
MSDQAERLAALHATAFDAPWDAAAFDDLLAGPGVFVVESADGFILMRAVADEAEILTLAVRPEARGRGEGGRLTAGGVAGAAARGAERVFLEVADDNVSALAVYRRGGFAEVGRRPRYYARPDGSRRDAILLARAAP